MAAGVLPPVRVSLAEAALAALEAARAGRPDTGTPPPTWPFRKIRPNERGAPGRLGLRRMVTCHPCGVEFHARRADQIDELVAAVQQHAFGSHGHEVAREHTLSELVPA
jgi:predicted small metal-binding protein